VTTKRRGWGRSAPKKAKTGRKKREKKQLESWGGEIWDFIASDRSRSREGKKGEAIVSPPLKKRSHLRPDLTLEGKGRKKGGDIVDRGTPPPMKSLECGKKGRKQSSFIAALAERGRGKKKGG